MEKGRKGEEDQERSTLTSTAHNAGSRTMASKGPEAMSEGLCVGD